jgi:hypothetical protein
MDVASNSVLGHVHHERPVGMALLHCRFDPSGNVAWRRSGDVVHWPFLPCHASFMACLELENQSRLKFRYVNEVHENS